MKNQILILLGNIILIIITCIYISACKKIEFEATSLEIVSGNNQKGIVERTLENPIVIIVKDQEGNGFAGIDVSFTVSEGSVSATTLITNVNGVASTRWTLGPTIGTQTLNATVTGLTGSPITLNAVGAACMDYDGNIYKVVTIGSQTWMDENLKVKHYPNGQSINNVTNNTAWANLADNNTSDAYCFYDNNINNDYGALYTWAAAMGDNAESSYTNPSGVQGVCPDGWHLPSEAEWYELTDYLGDIYEAGGKMKEIDTLHWEYPNYGATNSSGFTALPGGLRDSEEGFFEVIGYYGFWWSTSDNGSSRASYFQLSYTDDFVHSGTRNKSTGFSVRCVKD